MKKILSTIAVFTLFFGLCNNAYSNFIVDVTSNDDNECVVDGLTIYVKPYNQNGRTLNLHITSNHDKDMTMNWDEWNVYEEKSMLIKANEETDVEINHNISPQTLTFTDGNYTLTYHFNGGPDLYAPELTIEYAASKGTDINVKYKAKDIESRDYSQATGKPQIKSATVKLSDGQKQNSNNDEDVIAFKNLTPNTTYTVTVSVTDYAGNTTSKSQSVTTGPSAPSVSVSSITIETATLSWNAVSGATSYKIDNGTKVETVSGTSYPITNLKPGTKYTYSVTAYNGNTQKESAKSTKSFTTKELKIDNRKVSASYESATLSWNTSLDVAKYYIYKDETLLATYSAPNPQAWVNTMNCTIRDLEPGKSYSGYYIIAETKNKHKSKREDGTFPSFTTNNFYISGPNPLCDKASYTIIGVDGVKYSVYGVTCSTSTVKITNGSTNSFELKSVVVEGTGYIEITVKSKSTGKNYKRRLDFSIGLYGAPSSVNVPTKKLNKGTTYSASVRGGTSDFTYTWNIEQSKISSGQGTRNITLIINGNGSNIPRTAANNQDEDFDNPRSTRKEALQPDPSIPTLPLLLSGSVRAQNSCGTKILNFTVTYNQPQPNMRIARLDSVETIAIAEEVLSSIESESVPQENSFVVYPNPASSVINIRQPYDKESISTVDIFDATGRKCISEVFSNEDSFATIDIEALPKGTYILIINQNGNSQVGKFIKE